jgi:ribonuclease P protein component
MTGSDPPLSSVRRLTQRKQFLFARGGRAERRKTLVIQARRRADDVALPVIGAGFTATKQIGNAVTRNRAKRRLRAAATLLLPHLGAPGADYVFIARDTTATADWRGLLDDMETALISLASL